MLKRNQRYTSYKTLLSFKELGNIVSNAKEINALPTSQRKRRQSQAVRNILDNLNEGDTASDLIKKWRKGGMNDDAIKDVLIHAGNSEKVTNFNKEDAIKALKDANIPTSRKYKDANPSSVQPTQRNTHQVQPSAQPSVQPSRNPVVMPTVESAPVKTSTRFDKIKNSFSNFGANLRGRISDGWGNLKTKFAGLKSSALNIVAGMKQTAVENLPLVMASAGAAIYSGIHSFAASVRKNQLNAGKDNLNKYNKKINKYKGKINDVNSIKDEFNQLSKGVDNNTNENIGLTTSEYERYLSLKRQLVKTNKDLVKSTNSEGDAIIDNNKAIDSTIQKNEQKLQQSKQEVANKKNLAIQNEAAFRNMDKLQNGAKFGDMSTGETIERFITGGKSGIGIGGTLAGAGIGTLLGGIIGSLGGPVGTAIGASLGGTAAQITANGIGSFVLGTSNGGFLHNIFGSQKSIEDDGFASNKANMLSMIQNKSAYKKEAKSLLGKNAKLDKLSDDQFEKLLNNGHFDAGGLGITNKAFEKQRKAAKKNFDQQKKYVKDFKDSTLKNTLEASQGFGTLDKTSQKFASNLVKNFDVQATKVAGKDGVKYLEQQEERVRQLTQKMSTSSDVQNAYKKFNNIKSDTSMKASDWQKKMNSQFATLKNITGTSQKELANALGVSFSGKNILTSNGQNIGAMINSLVDTFSKANQKLGNKKRSSTLSKYFDQLSVDQLSDAYDVLQNQNQVFTGSFSQLKARLKHNEKYRNNGLGYTIESYQQAAKSDDDDASYNTFVAGLKQTRSDYSAGKVGTDQFKQMSGLISPKGETDAKSFKKNYDHIMQYFTSDKTGPNKFISDLKGMTNAAGKSMVELDKKTGKYKINVDNTAKAAKKMGMGLQPFEAILNNLKTYGNDVKFDSMAEKYAQVGNLLDQWSQSWQKGGGINGDAQGQEIENYRQKLTKIQDSNGDISDKMVTTIKVKMNVGDAASKVQDAIDTFEANYKDNGGKNWSKTENGQKALQAVFDQETGLFVKSQQAQKAVLSEIGKTTNAKYNDDLKKYDKKVQNTQQRARETGDIKDVHNYEKAASNRSKFVQNSASDDQYTLKTQFKNRKEANSELKRIGATVGKDGIVSADKGSNTYKDAKTVIDAYNKSHKDQKIELVVKGKDTNSNSGSSKSKKSSSGSDNSKDEGPKNKKSSEVPDISKLWGGKNGLGLFGMFPFPQQNGNKNQSNNNQDNKQNPKNGINPVMGQNGLGLYSLPFQQQGNKQNGNQNQNGKNQGQNNQNVKKGTKDLSQYPMMKMGSKNPGTQFLAWAQLQQNAYKDGKKLGKDVVSPELPRKKDHSKDVDPGTKLGKAIGSKEQDAKKVIGDASKLTASIAAAINTAVSKAQTKPAQNSYQKPQTQSGTQNWQNHNTKYEQFTGGVRRVASTVAGGARTIGSTVVNGAKSFGGGIRQAGITVISGARNLGSTVINGAKNIGGTAVNSVKSLGSGVIGSAKSLFSGLVGGVKGLFGGSKSFAKVSTKDTSKSSSKASNITVNAKGNAKKTIDSIKKSLSGIKTKNISVHAKGNAKKTISSIKKGLSGLKTKRISVNVKGNAKKTISSIKKGLSGLKTKNISVKIKGGAAAAAKKISSAIKRIKSKSVSVKVKDSASGKINSIKGKLNSVGHMHPNPKVKVDVSGIPQLQQASSLISGLHSKSVTVSVNYQQSGSPGGKNGAHGIGLAHGSMAWSKAFSQGTVSDLTDFDDWDGEAFAHGSVKKLPSRALAGGDLGANYSGTTLTGELGPELVVYLYKPQYI